MALLPFIGKNYIAPKGSGWPYIKYRALRPVLKGYYRIPRKFSSEKQPWLSPESIALINDYLKPNMKGFEWGSGTSTLYFSKRLGQLTSIEHHHGWYLQVKKWLQEKGQDNVNLVFTKVDYPTDTENKDKYNKAITDKQIAAYSYYVNTINRYEDNSLDFVLVDGRSRVACGLAAINKVKPGGLLVLDNAERERYNPLKEALKGWNNIYTTNGLSDTVLYYKN